MRFQPLPNRITFKEFVEWKPDKVGYELHDGVIVEIPQPLGGHEEITGFSTLELSAEIKRLKLPYLVPKQALVKPIESESGYLPDILILNRPSLASEPLWENESTVSLATSIPLVIEVVSTNWRDDYYKKYGEYEGIGISEYWIVDYLAHGGRKFISNPKLPTISIYSLVEGEYQVSQFRGNEQIQSSTLPELNLTTEEIFSAGIV